MSSLEDLRCTNELTALGNNTEINAFYFNGSCHLNSDTKIKEMSAAFFSQYSAVSPAEEFFE